MSGDRNRRADKVATRRQVVAHTTAAAATLVLPPLAYAQERGPVHIKSSEVTLDGGKAVIDNKGLSSAVTGNKTSALTDLNAVFPSLQADQVSLDKDGRIVISNEDAAKKLKAFTDSAPMAGRTIFDNCSCIDVRCK
jgi:hypothetical protein